MKRFNRQAGHAATAALFGALIAVPLGVASAQTSSSGPTATAPVTAAPPSNSSSSTATTPNTSAQTQSAPAAGGATAQAKSDPEVERRITDLHKRLRITQQQEQQFNAFAEVMRTNAQAMDSMAQQAQQNQNSNAVDDLKAFEQFTEAHAEGLKRLIPPFQTLYESLNDQQKKVADSVLGHAAEHAQQRQTHPRG